MALQRWQCTGRLPDAHGRVISLLAAPATNYSETMH